VLKLAGSEGGFYPLLTILAREGVLGGVAVRSAISCHCHGEWGGGVPVGGVVVLVLLLARKPSLRRDVSDGLVLVQ
jgi:hypothetical protein